MVGLNKVRPGPGGSFLPVVPVLRSRTSLPLLPRLRSTSPSSSWTLLQPELVLVAAPPTLSALGLDRLGHRVPEPLAVRVSVIPVLTRSYIVTDRAPLSRPALPKSPPLSFALGQGQRTPKPVAYPQSLPTSQARCLGGSRVLRTPVLSRLTSTRS